MSDWSGVRSCFVPHRVLRHQAARTDAEGGGGGAADDGCSARRGVGGGGCNDEARFGAGR